MKKKYTSSTENTGTKRGYNEKNPGESQGAFPPDSHKHKPRKEDIKSNAADKKAKEDNQ